ncbi:hypothetical protein GCM10008967_00020 [Bacillus carboniphilus]|uniref:Uncharacterized protein n=1 Tax=Bacillus carboniphilus TaxID=86663 RepID=A0ABP3FAW0_9BACI
MIKDKMVRLLDELEKSKFTKKIPVFNSIRLVNGEVVGEVDDYVDMPEDLERRMKRERTHP